MGRYGWVTAEVSDEETLESALEWLRESYWLKAPPRSCVSAGRRDLTVLARVYRASASIGRRIVVGGLVLSVGSGDRRLVDFLVAVVLAWVILILFCP